MSSTDYVMHHKLTLTKLWSYDEDSALCILGDEGGWNSKGSTACLGHILVLIQRKETILNITHMTTRMIQITCLDPPRPTTNAVYTYLSNFQKGVLMHFLMYHHYVSSEMWSFVHIYFTIECIKFCCCTLSCNKCSISYPNLFYLKPLLDKKLTNGWMTEFEHYLTLSTVLHGIPYYNFCSWTFFWQKKRKKEKKVSSKCLMWSGWIAVKFVTSLKEEDVVESVRDILTHVFERSWQ